MGVLRLVMSARKTNDEIYKTFCINRRFNPILMTQNTTKRQQPSIPYRQQLNEEPDDTSIK